MTNKEKIIKISKELGLSHIGSNLSCLPVLEEIYQKKKDNDIVILDNAHAHLAHLVAQNKYPTQLSREIIELYGIHCDRQAGCDASGGSLGHGLGIGIGYALADRERDVYVIVSEGSMMEGSSWEALRTIEFLKIKNIKIHCNFNGYSAVAEIDQDWIDRSLRNYAPSCEITIWSTDNGEGFEGLSGHYKIL